MRDSDAIEPFFEDGTKFKIPSEIKSLQYWGAKKSRPHSLRIASCYISYRGFLLRFMNFITLQKKNDLDCKHRAAKTIWQEVNQMLFYNKMFDSNSSCIAACYNTYYLALRLFFWFWMNCTPFHSAAVIGHFLFLSIEKIINYHFWLLNKVKHMKFVLRFIKKEIHKLPITIFGC